MKVVFEIKGDVEIESDTIGCLNDLAEIINQLRGFASAEGKYKIVANENEWIKIE